MTQPNSPRHALVFMAVVLTLVALVSAASAQEQTWFLGNDDLVPKVMYKDDPSSCGEVTVPSTGIIWSADNPAVTAVDLSETWSVNLSIRTGKTGGTHPFTAELGVWNETALSFTSFGTYTLGQATNTYSWVNFTITATDFIVPQDSYLAFRLTHGIGGHNLFVDACPSSVTSPSTDPGYPVPELSTFVLFGVGLLGLVGYVSYRKRT